MFYPRLNQDPHSSRLFSSHPLTQFRSYFTITHSSNNVLYYTLLLVYQDSRSIVLSDPFSIRSEKFRHRTTPIFAEIIQKPVAYRIGCGCVRIQRLQAKRKSAILPEANITYMIGPVYTCPPRRSQKNILPDRAAFPPDVETFANPPIICPTFTAEGFNNFQVYAIKFAISAPNYFSSLYTDLGLAYTRGCVSVCVQRTLPARCSIHRQGHHAFVCVCMDCYASRPLHSSGIAKTRVQGGILRLPGRIQRPCMRARLHGVQCAR